MVLREPRVGGAARTTVIVGVRRGAADVVLIVTNGGGGRSLQQSASLPARPSEPHSVPATLEVDTMGESVDWPRQTHLDLAADALMVLCECSHSVLDELSVVADTVWDGVINTRFV